MDGDVPVPDLPREPMFFVHEIHSLTSSRAAGYEALLRERWTPAVASEPGTRLVWCVRSMPGSVSTHELVTLTAVADGPTLERYARRVREGDLREDAAALNAARVGGVRRVLANLRFSSYEPDLDTLPVLGNDAPDAIYIHDFVPPRIGMQRPYEDGMGEIFMRALDVEYADFVMWAGFETVAGGGPMPESLMLTLIRNPDAATKLLGEGNPRESIKPGAWLYEALKLRDSWTSRMVRTVSWSPTA